MVDGCLIHERSSDTYGTESFAQIPTEPSAFKGDALLAPSLGRRGKRRLAFGGSDAAMVIQQCRQAREALRLPGHWTRHMAPSNRRIHWYTLYDLVHIDQHLLSAPPTHGLQSLDDLSFRRMSTLDPPDPTEATPLLENGGSGSDDEDDDSGHVTAVHPLIKFHRSLDIGEVSLRAEAGIFLRYSAPLTLT